MAYRYERLLCIFIGTIVIRIVWSSTFKSTNSTGISIQNTETRMRRFVRQLAGKNEQHGPYMECFNITIGIDIGIGYR